MHLAIPRYPASVDRATSMTLWVAAQPADVLTTPTAEFVNVEADRAVEIDLRLSSPARSVRVRPARLGIEAVVEGTRLRLQTPEPPCHVVIEIDDRPLILSVDLPEPSRPDRRDARTIYFEAGKLHDVGRLEPEPGQSVYIEAGAVVRGTIVARGCDGIRVRGRGVLDGGQRQGRRYGRQLVLERCPGAVVEDLTLVNPCSWMLVLVASDGASVRGTRHLGAVVGSDGIDVVGSRGVRIDRCVIKNNDDCVAVKAHDVELWPAGPRADGQRDVRDLLVERCTFMNDRAGNVIEIGHELRCDQVRDVTFRDCDLLHCHGHGAPLSIHAGDRATVSRVSFEDLRIEHFYDKLIDFRVMKSRFNRDADRGRITDVLLRDIDVTESPFNAGYSTSLIGGWDAEHRVERVRFENFRLGGRRVRSADELDLHTRHAGEVEFV